MTWQPIETASAVGKKRLLFKLARGSIVTGWRLANSKSVAPEFADQFYLATHWMPLPSPPQEKDKG